MGQSASEEEAWRQNQSNEQQKHQIPELELLQAQPLDLNTFRKLPIIETIYKNIVSDFEGNYTTQNLQKVITFYVKVYQNQNLSQRKTLYNQLKLQFTDQRQIAILDWLQNQRCNKYDSQKLITAKPLKSENNFSKIEICRIQVNLIPSKVLSHGNINSVKENASLEAVKIGPTIFQLKYLKNNGVNKQYLFRQNKNHSIPTPTPWIVEKTKDHRYVWRGDIDLDRHNVDYLLKFILKNRDQLDECPSIIINAGSHGGKSGQNSNDSGMMQYSDLDIYDEIIEIIFNLIEKAQNLGLKLSRANIKRKIYVHMVSLNIPCIYPENADHIIDVQCRGAYSKIPALSLHPKNSPIIEQDLQFLLLKQQSHNLTTTKDTKMEKQQDKDKLKKPFPSEKQGLGQQYSWSKKIISDTNQILVRAKAIKIPKFEPNNQINKRMQALREKTKVLGIRYQPKKTDSKSKIQFTISSALIRQILAKNGPFKYDDNFDRIDTFQPIQVQLLSSNDVYVGQVDKTGNPCGRGKLVVSSGSSLFEGYWKDGKLNGRGRFIDDSGNSYQGQWKDGLFHGKGVMQNYQGQTFDGYFVNGMKSPDQFAIQTEPNGSYYECHYLNGKKNGHGKMVCADGFVFQGEFKQDAINGHGKATFKNGDYYEGEWRNNKKHGKGILKQSDGTVYIGQFVQNKKKLS